MKHTSIATVRANRESHLTITILFFITALLLLTKPAQASSLGDWSTATHIGYAVNKDSSTGFNNVGGSLFFLDLLKPVSNDLEVGMRTIAQGGEESSNEYYRMGVGPLLSWSLTNNWRAQFSFSFFNETANDSTRERAYQSKGRTYQIGWERTKNITEKLEIAWGGFYMMHQGDINMPNRPTGTAASTRFANISTNRGSSRGVEVALRFML